MATRATYQIDGMTFYCHWDGYPAGAAVRFLNMIKAMTQPETGSRRDLDVIEDRRGGAAFAFVRGNLDAEPITDHDAVGGTEWRYTVETSAAGDMTIKVESSHWDSNTWRLRFHGELAAWLDKQETTVGKIVICTTEDYINNGASWGKATCWKYATEEAAAMIAEQAERLAREYPAGNPNAAHYAAVAKLWREALEQRKAA